MPTDSSTIELSTSSETVTEDEEEEEGSEAEKEGEASGSMVHSERFVRIFRGRPYPIRDTRTNWVFYTETDWQLYLDSREQEDGVSK